MDSDTRRLIEAIHQTPHQCVLALTGGGTGAAALLLGVPGGSRTVLEAIVPYHEQALVEFLGRRPARFCSAETSQEMAARAYARARWLAAGANVVGIGCTASLATDRPKRGDHRFHLTVHGQHLLQTISVTLRKGARDREAEEAVLDAVLLNALAEALEIDERVVPPLLADDLVELNSPKADLLVWFLCQKEPTEPSTVCARVDGQLTENDSRPVALLPGAFNPVHEGHWGLASAAARVLGAPVAFELSAANVDKGLLPIEETRRRLAQFTWRAPVWITRAPTFAEKASLFPGVVFIVGADTAERIVSPRYYQDSEKLMAEALEHIRRQGCRFLVAGRTDHTGKHVGLEDLVLPETYRDLFTGIPKTAFHVAISSTALRAPAAKAQTVAPSEEAE